MKKRIDNSNKISNNKKVNNSKKNNRLKRMKNKLNKRKGRMIKY
jgi:hypothetical protein